MAKAKQTQHNKDFNFEASLTELNKLVETMEKGEIPLEESLQQFEHGIKLVRECQQALSKAEQKVQKLIAKNGDIKLEPYEPEE